VAPVEDQRTMPVLAVAASVPFMIALPAVAVMDAKVAIGVIGIFGRGPRTIEPIVAAPPPPLGVVRLAMLALGPRAVVTLAAMPALLPGFPVVLRALAADGLGVHHRHDVRPGCRHGRTQHRRGAERSRAGKHYRPRQ